MEQASQVLKEGSKVVTNRQLGSVAGIVCNEQHLRARRPNTVGTLKGVVPGHGGEVHFVLHEGETVAAVYCWDEFEFYRAKK